MLYEGNRNAASSTAPIPSIPLLIIKINYLTKKSNQKNLWKPLYDSWPDLSTILLLSTAASHCSHENYSIIVMYHAV